MLTAQPKKKRAANRKKRLQIKKTTFVNLTTHTLQMLTTQPKKKRAANKMYLVVLWAFAVCFFICLCCEHFHHLLSNWWKCFLDLLVLFLFACVFWSCSTLSSLGHRMNELMRNCTFKGKVYELLSFSNVVCIWNLSGDAGKTFKILIIQKKRNMQEIKTATHWCQAWYTCYMINYSKQFESINSREFGLIKRQTNIKGILRDGKTL